MYIFSGHGDLLEQNSSTGSMPFFTFLTCVVQPSNWDGNPIISSQIAIDRYPIIASCDMLGKQLQYSLKPLKHGKTMQNLDISSNVFIIFFDASSLLTNVALDETIRICLEAFYDKSDSQPVISKKVFVELMSATSSVELSFNNTIFKQID